MKKILIACIYFILALNVYSQNHPFSDYNNLLFRLDFEYSVFYETLKTWEALNYQPENDSEVGILYKFDDNNWYNKKSKCFFIRINNQWTLTIILLPDDLHNIRSAFVNMQIQISNELGIPPEVSTNNNTTTFSWAFSERKTLNITKTIILTCPNDNSRLQINYLITN